MSRIAPLLLRVLVPLVAWLTTFVPMDPNLTAAARAIVTGWGPQTIPGDAKIAKAARKLSEQFGVSPALAARALRDV